jgi:hypothetical protein
VQAGALVELLRARAVPRVDDEADRGPTAPVELGHRLTQQGGSEPAASPGAGDGELAHPALALVVRAENHAGHLSIRLGDEPEPGLERLAVEHERLPLLERLRLVPLVVGERVLNERVHRARVALPVERPDTHPFGPGGRRGRTLERHLHSPVRPHRLVTGPLEQRAGARMVGRHHLAEPEGLARRQHLGRPALAPGEQLGAEAAATVLRVDVRDDVVALGEGRVRGDSLAVEHEQGVLLETEAGAIPVGEEVVELEVGRAELVDVTRDDELRDRLCVVPGRRAGGEAGDHQ